MLARAVREVEQAAREALEALELQWLLVAMEGAQVMLDNRRYQYKPCLGLCYNDPPSPRMGMFHNCLHHPMHSNSNSLLLPKQPS